MDLPDFFFLSQTQSNITFIRNHLNSELTSDQMEIIPFSFDPTQEFLCLEPASVWASCERVSGAAGRSLWSHSRPYFPHCLFRKDFLCDIDEAWSTSEIRGNDVNGYLVSHLDESF